jgi:hypothetical protein
MTDLLVYRCSQRGCDYQMLDASYGDVEDHTRDHFHDPDCLWIDKLHDGPHVVRPDHPRLRKERVA